MNTMLESQPDMLAMKVTDMWVKWDSLRSAWKDEKEELRNYLFATSTRTTSNSKLPWKNSTTTPKLTQIRDNLHANYLAALFPNENWFMWESNDKSPKLAEKRRAITAYMQQKLKASNFQLLVSQLVYDYIDYGNVFATYAYVRETTGDKNGYVGPKAYRIGSLDVVMNPLAESFARSPIVHRMLKSIGELVYDSQTKPALKYDTAALNKAMEFRSNFRDDADFRKNVALSIDGFGTLEEYVNSDMVEILEFWGDIWDSETRTYLRDQIITVIDRMWVLRKGDNPSWTGEKPVYHCGWRLRPDNLWAQGPLDQLVGMQYRIDHLENLKADVFDVIAYPVQKIKGNTVEAFEYEPGAQIFCGDEGDVDFLRPDSTALNADMQIQELMNRMEEMAGAPKQAMGIRTPGEKTKYEVQTLENAAGRIFQSKVSWFERNILEPLLNGMLAEAVRNFDSVERIRTVDSDYNTEVFIEVTKDDLMAAGHIYPVGARHFAEQARFVQELAQTMAAVQAIPTVAAHISGKAIAKALEENLGWHNYNIVKDNAAVLEQQETQRIINTAQADLQAENAVNPNPTPGGTGEQQPNQAQTGR
jgi:hypothetical protein